MASVDISMSIGWPETCSKARLAWQPHSAWERYDQGTTPGGLVRAATLARWPGSLIPSTPDVPYRNTG